MICDSKALSPFQQSRNMREKRGGGVKGGGVFDSEQSKYPPPPPFLLLCLFKDCELQQPVIIGLHAPPDRQIKTNDIIKLFLSDN